MKLKFTFILFILATAFSFSPPEEIIVWREGHLLAWKDFKGQAHDPDCVASTTCDIDKKVIDYNDSAIVKIEAVFLPQRSWKRKCKSGKDILIHEQKHFDIAEVYARKLRKEIMAEAFTNYDALVIKVNHLRKKIMKELNHYQDKYDHKTDHSRNVERQEKWNEKVALELSKWNTYKTQQITIYFNKKAGTETASR